MALVVVQLRVSKLNKLNIAKMEMPKLVSRCPPMLISKHFTAKGGTTKTTWEIISEDTTKHLTEKRDKPKPVRRFLAKLISKHNKVKVATKETMLGIIPKRLNAMTGMLKLVKKHTPNVNSKHITAKMEMPRKSKQK